MWYWQEISGTYLLLTGDVYTWASPWCSSQPDSWLSSERAREGALEGSRRHFVSFRQSDVTPSPLPCCLLEADCWAWSTLKRRGSYSVRLAHTEEKQSVRTERWGRLEAAWEAAYHTLCLMLLCCVCLWALELVSLAPNCYFSHCVFFSFLNFYWSVIDLQEKAMATHSSTLAWKIPWMEEPGRLQSVGLLGVRYE